MKIIKKTDHVVIQNELGEYHLDLKLYESLGELEATKLAESEIIKKTKSDYTELDIDFNRARDLGFCEYGIRDFCNQLNLDIEKTYKLSDLRNLLTAKVFIEYPNECFKLFGKNVFTIFGGPRKFLDENRTRNALNLILDKLLTDTDNHRLACSFALETLSNFENKYPGDKRPRLAIQAKLDWLDGNITQKELDAAGSAAWSAWSAAGSAWSAAGSARSAAWSAAWSARSAAWSAAWSARSAAWSAADPAAKSALLNSQIDKILEIL